MIPLCSRLLIKFGLTKKQMGEKSILKKLGQGTFSLTFLWYLKKKVYVLKCPLKKRGPFYKKWFFHTQQEILFLKKYAPKQNKITLPKIEEYSDTFILQQKVEGIPLTKRVYDVLSEKEQEVIAYQLADFFIKLHKKVNFKKVIKNTKKNSFSKYNQLLDEDEKETLKKYKYLLKKNPLSETFPCLCITDLKAEHILYNKKNKKLGLVDFGSFHFSLPEDEFILKNPIRSHLSMKMLKNTIEAYNLKKGYPAISLKRIKAYLILFSVQEVYDCYKKGKITQSEKKRVKCILFDFLKEIERIFSFS